MEKTYDPHKSTAEVRQANDRRMNLRVLLLSTGIAAVLLAAIVLIFFLI